MRVNRSVNRALIFSVSLLVLLTMGTLAGAQEEEAPAPEATPTYTVAPATDSLAMAPNDSTMIAREIQAMIKQEQSSFSYRVKNSGIGQNYMKGGLFMHFLLLASVVGLVFIIERLWTLSRALFVKMAFKVLSKNVRKHEAQSPPFFIRG
jgi:hypothetical protein